MKTTALVLLLLVSGLTVHADNILANSDFADGTAHWRGDGKGSDSDDGGGSPLGGGSGSGITISLKSPCAYITQDFSTRETSLNVTITYKLSSDYQANWITDSPPGTTPPPTATTDIKAILAQLFGIPINGTISVHPTSWLAIIVDPKQAKICYSYFTPTNNSSNSANPATTTVTISHLLEFENKSFYLVFPPGQGSVNLTKVSLDPTDASGGTSGAPLPNP